MGHKRHREQPSAEPDLFMSGQKERQVAKRIYDQIKAIAEECFPDNKAFTNCIEALGVPVVIHTQSKFRLKLCMKLAGMELGYNSPLLKNYTQFIQVLKTFCPYQSHMDYSAGVILILDEGNYFPFLIGQLYHALAYQAGLPGYHDRALKLYRTFERRYRCQLNPKFLSKLSTEDKIQLRFAVRREKESINLIQSSVMEIFVPKNNAKLLESGEAQA
jgi:hypothetical protein